MREMRERDKEGDGDSTITFLNADEETKNTQRRAAPASGKGGISRLSSIQVKMIPKKVIHMNRDLLVLR